MVCVLNTGSYSMQLIHPRLPACTVDILYALRMLLVITTWCIYNMYNISCISSLDLTNL